MNVGIRQPIADRYELRERLGSGGMAEVYDAVDLRLDRPVALKLLRRGLVTAPAMVARAEAEARLAAKIHHPNVVAILDAGRVDGMPYVVMERLSGETLADRLQRAPLDEDEIRSIGEQLLRGLAAAHELGVVHRDVKPSNVLVATRDGRTGGSPGAMRPDVWKVADFGIATWLAADTTLSATGEIVGSAPYLPPERLDGKPAIPASDVFSAGVVLYEAATGRRPVERDDALATVMALRDGAAEPLDAHRPGLDADLRRAIERAIAVDPESRWPSAAAFADALQGARRHGASHAATTGSPGGTSTVPLPPVDRTEVMPASPSAAPVPDTTDGTEPIPGPGRGTGTLPAAPPATPELRPPKTRETAVASSGSEPRATRWRRVRAFRSDPSRALRVLVGAAVALLLVIAVVTVVIAAGDDAPATRPAPIDGSVPAELRDSLDALQEAIGR